MTIRKDTMLNRCGDTKIENGDTVLIDGLEQIKQSAKIHMQTLLGEIPSNINIGMPWREEILQKWPRLTEVEQYFIEGMLEVPGIIRVNGVTITPPETDTRTYTISVDATAEGDDGEEDVIFDYQGVLPAGTCDNTSDDDFPLTIDNLRIWFDFQDLGNMTYNPSTPYFRVENKAGEGYALGDGYGANDLVDGDMEESGVTDWTALSATLTKQTTDPYGGTRLLRVSTTGTNGRAYQNILTTGKDYRLHGWARSQDGTNAPVVFNNVDVEWTGTTSTSWQEFDVSITADSQYFGLGATANGAVVEFDDVTVKRGDGTWPLLVGVSYLNNKRAAYINNTSSNDKRQHFKIYDTQAIRHSSNELTMFFVGKWNENSVGNGLLGLTGQDDLGTTEECVYWTYYQPETGSNPIMKIFSDTDAATIANSYGQSGVSGLYNPFYSAGILKSGSVTDFYFDGVYTSGNNTISTRKLDGNGYIGSGIATDCVEPSNFNNLYIGEILVYEGILTDDEIDQVNTWLASKWGF